jgi:hypothetical protein
MSIAFGIKNGMCFGLDISAMTDDVVVQGNDVFCVNGIVFSSGPFYMIIGVFEVIFDNEE